jgi:DNA-binding NarL/FixJ family response regulator
MRILLADDQPQVRFALRTLLERKLDASVIGEASDTEELLQQLRESCPDLLLLDWELPGQNGRSFVTALRARCPHLAVIALSGRIESRQAVLQAGLDAFVCKCDYPEELLLAIRQIEQDRSAAQPNGAEDDGRPTQECQLEKPALERKNVGGRR